MYSLISFYNLLVFFSINILCIWASRWFITTNTWKSFAKLGDILSQISLKLNHCFRISNIQENKTEDAARMWKQTKTKVDAPKSIWNKIDAITPSLSRTIPDAFRKSQSITHKQYLTILKERNVKYCIENYAGHLHAGQ